METFRIGVDVKEELRQGSAGAVDHALGKPGWRNGGQSDFNLEAGTAESAKRKAGEKQVFNRENFHHHNPDAQGRNRIQGNGSGPRKQQQNGARFRRLNQTWDVR
jgi:hypothetical protein